MLFDAVWQKVLTTVPVVLPVAWNITDIFGPSLSRQASILLPSDVNYTSRATQRWTLHNAPSFIGTIQPATVQDVQNIVRISVARGIPFLVTGGNHGLSKTLAKCQGGVQVDLVKLSAIEIEDDRALMTVGGGVKFSDILIYWCIAMGTAHCVGVVGATLGGGVSSGQGVMGLLVDLLESAEVVTSFGTAITASRDVNPELFWSLAGAGANFGAVTSATYRLPRVINGGNVVNANYLYPATMGRSVFEALASFDDTLGPELAFNTAAFYNPEADQMVIMVNANYYGSRSEAEDILGLFLDLGPLQHEMLVVPWPRVFETSYFGVNDTKACARNQHVNMYSVSAIQTDVDAMSTFLDQVLSFSRAHPDVATTFVVHRFPTGSKAEAEAAPRLKDDRESVYPYRQNKMHIQMESSYSNISLDNEVDRFLQDARHRFVLGSGYKNQSVYVNFAHGDEGAEAWYSAPQLKRLRQLKREWDPKGVFSYFNPIS
ncbi:hypothetical protein F5Y19DRAFT_491338 [Xylariaceae sp. FL1651]|nr:hypothetical protein F5Y19DRAFT_491338 [Xylariaceae sp. FL1651]